MTKIKQTGYITFLKEVKDKVQQARLKALKAVNKELLALYWEIGRIILVNQQKNGWGKSIVEKLAVDLQSGFPGMKGFSSPNLWRMRKFYQTYTKLAPLVREISWSHHVILFEKVKTKKERDFYMRMTKEYGWSKNILIHQIENMTFRKFQTNQTNFDKAIAGKYRYQAKLAVKDEYTFDFLELSNEYDERELELALLRNIRKFLLEMGSDFTFIGNQYKLRVGNEFYYIDLLLYHRKLKSLIAIELKAGRFKPEYAGKMQFYLTALNRTMRYKDENPSIGIIVCKEKDRTVVEFALNETRSPIGVAQYALKRSLPKKMRDFLPTGTEIAKRLKILDEWPSEEGGQSLLHEPFELFQKMSVLTTPSSYKYPQ